jgi:hypothetical protein
LESIGSIIIWSWFSFFRNKNILFCLINNLYLNISFKKMDVNNFVKMKNF